MAVWPSAADIHQVDRLEGAHVETLADRFEFRGVGYDRGGAAMVQYISEPLRLRRGVDHHEDGSSLERRENREHRLDGIFQIDHDPVAAPDTGSPQAPRESIAIAVDLAVGESA